MTKEIKYKRTELPYSPMIPEHWEVKRLKYVGEAIIGITYSPDDVTTEGNGLLVLRASNIQDGKLTFDDCVYVNKEVQEKHLTKEGDILICARNGSPHLVGKCAYLTKENEGLSYGAFMLVFRSAFGKFMYYIFSSELFKSQTGLFKTSTINQLTTDTINNLFIAIPKDTNEQERIADFLSLKTKEIDNLISQKEKLIEKLKEERIAFINQAVTKGLNEKAEMKASGVKWIGEIPKHWVVKRLKFVALYVQTGNTPPSAKEEYYNGEVNWFTPSDFGEELELKKSSRTISDLAVSEEVVRMFPANSVMIIGIGATLGKVGYILNTASSNQQINAMVFKNETEAKFYCYFLFANRPNIVGLTNAATLAILNQTQNKDIPVPVMGIDEMKLIVKKIEESDLKIKTAVNRIEKEIELIKEYKASLINEVVTGKIILN